MPEISRFFGIVVQMYTDDHAPPHFHARHAGMEIVVDIDALAVLQGRLSRRAQALLLEWASIHLAELRADWDLAQAGRPLKPIEPLR
ncbi:MAG: DUF4160 domain-containing protein [Chloroflexi bacterium]|nr:DUF4160 domain-containing protein [Chloroflexota bacterium]